MHLLLAEERYRERFRRPHPVVPNTTRVPATVRAARRAPRRLRRPPDPRSRGLRDGRDSAPCCAPRSAGRLRGAARRPRRRRGDRTCSPAPPRRGVARLPAARGGDGGARRRDGRTLPAPRPAELPGLAADQGRRVRSRTASRWSPPPLPRGRRPRRADRSRRGRAVRPTAGPTPASVADAVLDARPRPRHPRRGWARAVTPTRSSTWTGTAHSRRLRRPPVPAGLSADTIDVRSDGAWMTMSAPPTCSRLPRIANRGRHDDARLTCTSDVLNTIAWWTSASTRRVELKTWECAQALPCASSWTAETTSRTRCPGC